jgi:hypothetical protein
VLLLDSATIINNLTVAITMSLSTAGQKPSTPSPDFDSILEAALNEYKEKSGSGLLEHLLAEQVKRCDAIGAISAILKGQAREFQQFRVFPPTGAVFIEIGALLSVCIFVATIREPLLTFALYRREKVYERPTMHLSNCCSSTSRASSSALEFILRFRWPPNWAKYL